MPEGSAVQRMFSGIASRYDFANRVLSLGLCVGWREQLVAATKAAQPKTVADLATGSGDVAFALRRDLPGDCSIVGTCHSRFRFAPTALVRKWPRHDPSAIAAAVEVMRHGRLHRYNTAPGEVAETALLEEEFAAQTGARYCLAVASGGYALACALRAYGVGGGPPPFGPKDRSRFLEALEKVVREAKKGLEAPAKPAR